eukprot:TRINITY_DN16641_c0_g1_i1.p1 TRINITY_DN16641_c0_g1~~TRINITY_DN16641_c0_g1_i1.p1  ORF type:complete len:238 (-),score=47.20 TRINITY_DN16641_c0_g1_i1:643-1356(-)
METSEFQIQGALNRFQPDMGHKKQATVADLFKSTNTSEARSHGITRKFDTSSTECDWRGEVPRISKRKNLVGASHVDNLRHNDGAIVGNTVDRIPSNISNTMHRTTCNLGDDHSSGQWRSQYQASMVEKEESKKVHIQQKRHTQPSYEINHHTRMNIRANEIPPAPPVRGPSRMLADIGASIFREKRKQISEMRRKGSSSSLGSSGGSIVAGDSMMRKTLVTENYKSNLPGYGGSRK